jgi:putative aldouronate transport system substrate-binding protein
MKKKFFMSTAGIATVCILVSLVFLGCAQPSKSEMTLTMFSADINPDYDNFQSPIAQKIKEATGVTLDIQYPVGDPDEKLSTMLATGEYPDLIYPKGKIVDFVQAGALIDLTELIEKHGPNIKKLYGQYLKRHRYSPEDQSIYWLGCYQVDEVHQEAEGGFQVQLAVVKELGCPGIKTVKDFERVVSEYAKKHPTINGQPTIPYTLCFADGWRILISVTNSAVFATGGNGDDGEWYIDQETLRPVIHHTRPIEKEYFKWLNHMYDTGLLDRDCITQTYDTYIEKISSGRVLGLSDAFWEYRGAEDSLKANGMEERMYGTFPVVLEESIENKIFMEGGYTPNYGIGITTKCKDPVRAIQFLDWMCTEESQILRAWGIEGVDWEIRDGRRVRTAKLEAMQKSDTDWKRKTGLIYTYPFPEIGRGHLDSKGYQIKPEGSVETIRDQYSDFEKDVLQCYGSTTTWKALFKSDFPVKKYGNAWQINIPPGSEMQELFQKVQDVNWRRIPECIVCKPSEFDAKWDAYQEELVKTGVRKLEDQFYELIKARIEFWSD